MRRRIKSLSPEATAAVQKLADRTGKTYDEVLVLLNRRNYDDSNEILVFCEVVEELFPDVDDIRGEVRKDLETKTA